MIQNTSTLTTKSKSAYKRSEGHFRGYDGIDLYFQRWEKTPAKGTIIITHGHGEYSGSYQRLVDAFAENEKADEWTFYGWDLRGHGRSEGQRGYAASFDEYCKDFKIFLDMVMNDATVQQGPVILLCHSMGALIQTKVLLQHPEIHPDAVVISSPLFGLSVQVPQYKKAGADWLNRFLPVLTLGNEINNDDLTRDPDVIREFEHDPYRHTRISAGVYLGFLSSFPFVREHAADLRCKIFMQISDADPVISTPMAIETFERFGSKDKELKIYPQAKHELYNDTVRQQTFDDLKKFLDTIPRK